MTITELNADLSDTAARVCENGLPGYDDTTYFYVLGQEVGAYLMSKGFVREQPNFYRNGNINAFTDDGEIGFMVCGETLAGTEQVPC